MLDGNGVKTMPGSIPAPNLDSFEIKKNISNQMGQWVKFEESFLVWVCN